MNDNFLGITFEPTAVTARTLQGIRGHRVLIIGESHHSKEQEARPELTREEVEKWKTSKYRSRVPWGLPKLFSMDKPEFWNSVVYYNYLQTGFAVDGPAESGSDPVSSEAFQKVLDQIQPSRILVLGKDTWRKLPGAPGTIFQSPVNEPALPLEAEFGAVDPVDDHAMWFAYRPAGYALAMPIVHPASQHFSIGHVRPAVERWLNFAGAPPE